MSKRYAYKNIDDGIEDQGFELLVVEVPKQKIVDKIGKRVQSPARYLKKPIRLLKIHASNIFSKLRILKN